MQTTTPAVGTIVRSEVIPGARHWSLELARGYALRLTDLEGGANCAALFYNARNALERYNMADTLKAQHTAFLTRGHCLYSDMGRILVSIASDTLGWHDAFCGVGDAALTAAKYGIARYQEHRNACHRNGRDSLLVELGKWGLGLPDLVANVNFFSKVAVDEEGGLHFVAGHSPAGGQVELRAEMDTLVVLDTCPHPLDPSPRWAPKPVRGDVVYAGAAVDDDPCRLSRPENARGYANNARHHCQHDHRPA
ncbi:MAG: urea amidolyase associated protein UAAP1 [Gammaproteobacteria bacterium]